MVFVLTDSGSWDLGVFASSDSGSWDLCGIRIKRFWILGSLLYSYQAILDLGISVVFVLSDSMILGSLWFS